MIEYLWFVAAGTAGVARAGLLAYQKRLATTYSSLEISYASILFALPFVVTASVWGLWGVPFSLTPTALVAIVISGVCNVLGFLAYMRALRRDDLSIVAPLTSLTPFFVTLGEPFIRGITLTPEVFIGSIAAVVGSLIIVSEDIRDVPGLLTRLREVGPLFAIGSSLMYSGASIADKISTTSTHPFLVMLGVYAVMLLGFTLLLVRANHTYARRPRAVLSKQFIPLGVLQAGLTIAIFPAFAIAPSAAHVSIVVQLSLIFDVLLGWMVFGEQRIVQRLTGVLVLVGGVVFVV